MRQNPFPIFAKQSQSATQTKKYYSLLVAEEFLQLPSVPLSPSCAAIHHLSHSYPRQCQLRRFGWKNVLKLTIRVNQANAQTKQVFLTKKQFLYNTNTGNYIKAHLVQVGDHIASRDEWSPEKVHSASVLHVEPAGYKEVLEIVTTDRISYSAGDARLVITSLQSYSDHEPVHSFGVIAFRFNTELKHREYLLVQRRCSMGFMDLIRGKYCDRPVPEICQTYLQEMTKEEREKIVSWPFSQLWYSIWNVDMTDFAQWRLESLSLAAQVQYKKAKTNFENLPIKDWIHRLGTSQYNETEFGFPKGRPSLQEQAWETAVREFAEEVGCIVRVQDRVTNQNSTPPLEDQRIVLYMDSSIKPFVERFQATNGLQYIHTYYLAQFGDSTYKPRVRNENLVQASEIGSVGFFSFQDAIVRLRPYDREKKEVLIKVDAFLRNHPLGVQMNVPSNS